MTTGNLGDACVPSLSCIEAVRPVVIGMDTPYGIGHFRVYVSRAVAVNSHIIHTA